MTKQERDKQYQAEYYKLHKDKILQRSKLWKLEHPEKVKAYYREYNDTNREANSKYWKEYRKCNHAKILARNRLRKYGITEEVFANLFKIQKGKCRICRKSFGEFKLGACVDHCSQSGHVRSLLCSNCNTAIGLLNHSVVIAEQVLEYLRTEVLFNSK